MNWVRPAHAVIALALISVAVAAPACDAIAKPKKPPVEAPPPPPPPPPAPIGLPDRLVADAASYQTWVETVSAISPGFSNGADVAQALKVSAAYQPKAFIRGAIAYAAVAALKDPVFVASIRKLADTPENSRVVAGYFINNPVYATTFKGADEAAGLAEAALGSPALRLRLQGLAITKAAYDVQHQAWSKDEVFDREGRLASVKLLSDSPFAMPPSDKMSMVQRAASEVEPLNISAGPAPPPYRPMIEAALQLAAVAALGEATDSNYERLAAMAYEPQTDTCLKIAKLNLYQCLAVAKPHYEDIFCLGQHIMQDTSICMARSAGTILPLDIMTTPVKLPPLPKARAAAHRKRTRS